MAGLRLVSHRFPVLRPSFHLRQEDVGITARRDWSIRGPANHIGVPARDRLKFPFRNDLFKALKLKVSDVLIGCGTSSLPLGPVRP